MFFPLLAICRCAKVFLEAKWAEKNDEKAFLFVFTPARTYLISGKNKNQINSNPQRSTGYLLDTTHFIWLFWEVLGWKKFLSLVNWKVCCILWSRWQQNKGHSAAFKRHHLLWKSPVEFVPWTDEDIPDNVEIYFQKRLNLVSWLLSLIYTISGLKS